MHKLEVTKLLQNAVTHLQKRGSSVSYDLRAVVQCKGFDVKCMFLKSSLDNVKVEIMKPHPNQAACGSLRHSQAQPFLTRPQSSLSLLLSLRR